MLSVLDQFAGDSPIRSSQESFLFRKQWFIFGFYFPLFFQSFFSGNPFTFKILYLVFCLLVLDLHREQFLAFFFQLFIAATKYRIKQCGQTGAFQFLDVDFFFFQLRPKCCQAGVCPLQFCFYGV